MKNGGSTHGFGPNPWVSSETMDFDVDFDPEIGRFSGPKSTPKGTFLGRKNSKILALGQEFDTVLSKCKKKSFF